MSESGIGGSVGRTGLRLGMDAKRRKFFSAGLPGTGLSGVVSDNPDFRPLAQFFPSGPTAQRTKRAVCGHYAIKPFMFNVLW